MKICHGKIRLVVIASLFIALLAGSKVFAAGIGPGYSGWYQMPDGQWEYLVSGRLIKNADFIIDGKGYRFDENGILTEELADISGIPDITDAAAVGAAQQAAEIGPGIGADSSLASQAGEAEAEKTPEAREPDRVFDTTSYVSAAHAGRPNPYDLPDVVEIDIANQHVFCYRNGILVWDSYCVTGCVETHHDTPQGVFSIQSKERNRYLMGPINSNGKPAWKNWVDYWMPFYNGCGLHDASWRSKFAGSIYKYAGSHGCVNLPTWMAPSLFDLVYVGMPVVVHA